MLEMYVYKLEEKQGFYRRKAELEIVSIRGAQVRESGSPC